MALGKRPAGQPAARKEVLLGSVDLLAFAACLILALLLRFGRDVPPSHQFLYVFFWPILFAGMLVAARGFGLYDFRHKLSPAEHFFSGAGAAVTGAVGGYLFLVFLRTYHFPEARLSRLAVLLYILLLIGWFFASRAGMLAWLRRCGYRVRVVLIGSAAECRRLAEELRAFAPSMLEVAGIVVNDEGGGDHETEIIGSIQELEPIVRRRTITQGILVESGIDQPALRDVLASCERNGVELFAYPTLGVNILASTRVCGIAGVPLVSLRPAFERSVYPGVKRMMDIVAAALLLGATAPLIGAAAAAIRLTSPGPVIFPQERTGRGRAPFTLYKLRTMTLNAEPNEAPMLAAEDDPRITRVGRWLRRWRLDELPQLWNVLRGDMSLVGPRPERPSFVETFCRETPLYERRFLVRPGLTGLAQIHGRYDTDYTHKLRYDLIYINSLSLTTDCQILIATIQTVLTGRGAR